MWTRCYDCVYDTHGFLFSFNLKKSDLVFFFVSLMNKHLALEILAIRPRIGINGVEPETLNA